MPNTIYTRKVEGGTIIRHGNVRVILMDGEGADNSLQVLCMDGQGTWHTVDATPSEDALIGMMNGLEGDVNQLRKKIGGSSSGASPAPKAGHTFEGDRKMQNSETQKMAIHWTYREHLDSIAERGLEARESPVSGSAGVYMWDSSDEACEYASLYVEHTMQGGEPVALVVDVTGLELDGDDSGISDCPPELAKVARQDIPADRILGVEEWSAQDGDEDLLGIYCW